MEQKIEVLVGGRKKGKEKALNEITNKLDSRPIKLNPSWAGPKLSSGSSKETGKPHRAGQDKIREEGRVALLDQTS